MVLDEIQPFLGLDCAVIVNCRACGREHAHKGVLIAGSRRGEVIVSGVTYNVDDLVSIRSEAGEVSFALPLGRVLPYLGVAAGLASWLRFVHH
jgi:hypothetical protein